MSFISKKKIKGKEYNYLEKSVRLLDGKVKKFSIYLKESNKTKEKEKELNEKIQEFQTKYARSYFSGSLKENEISKNVALLHDYPLYEFTIVVKKEN